METGLTLNYSFTDFTSLYNSPNSTAEVSTREEPFEWTNAEIARLIQIIVRPILIAIGTIGNCLTIYIMRSTSLKDVSSCFYMSLLALADTSKFCIFKIM